MRLSFAVLACFYCHRVHAQEVGRDEQPRQLALPFRAAAVTVSSDGKLAAVWDAPRNSSSSLQSLAAIDLEKGQLLAQAFLPSRLQHVVVGDAIYTLGGNQIRRLSPQTLHPLATYDSETKAIVGSYIGSRSANHLMLVERKRISLGPHLRLGLPELKPLASYGHDVRPGSNWLDGRCGFGWFSEGVLWDDAMRKPQLLVWPFEFRRSPLRTSTIDRSKPFSPGMRRWHPFVAGKPIRAGVNRVRKVESPDIAASLALLQDDEGYKLSSYRLDTGELIASIRIGHSRQEQRTPFSAALATGGGRYVVMLGDRLFVGSLAPLRPKSRPFHIVPRQSTFVVAIDRAVKVRYEAPGATKFHLSSSSVGGDGKRLDITSQSGEFTLDMSALAQAALDHTARLAANLGDARRLNNRERAELFAKSSMSSFEQLFSRNSSGVPLPIAVKITAEGKDFETAYLQHDYLVEVPLSELENALDRIYPRSQDPWRKPSQPELNKYADNAQPPAGKGPLFDHLRTIWATPHPNLAGQALIEAAKQAKQLGDTRLNERFTEWIRSQQFRIWRDQDGRSLEAVLVRSFAGQVTLRSRKGFEMTVEEAKLTEADQAYLRKDKRISEPQDSDAFRSFLVGESLHSMLRFNTEKKLLPPAALSDDLKQPRLSWRVLLLDELGYPELLKLFHLDEPWNSPHNAKLIPFMPIAFEMGTTSSESKVLGKTTLLTVRSSLSAMPLSGVASLSSFAGEEKATVVLVEANKSQATEWSKPADLQLYQFRDPSTVIHQRNEKVLVGLLNGQALQIPASTSSEDWGFAVNRGDRRQVFEAFSPSE